MKRYLQAIGLTMVATMVAAAIASSSVWAVEFHSEVENTTLKGQQSGTDTWTFNAGTFKCTTVTYSGTKAAKTTTTLTLTPTFSGCQFEPIGTATINMNGCAFVIHSSGTTDIECPAGKSIELVAKAFGVTKCTTTIGPQNGGGAITFTNKGSGSTRHTHEHEHITTTYTQDAGSGIGACSSGTFSNGTITRTRTVFDYDSSGSQVGTWVE